MQIPPYRGICEPMQRWSNLAFKLEMKRRNDQFLFPAAAGGAPAA